MLDWGCDCDESVEEWERDESLFGSFENCILFWV